MRFRKLRRWIPGMLLLAFSLSVGVKLTFKERELIRVQYLDIYLQNLKQMRTSVESLLSTQALALRSLLEQMPLDDSEFRAARSRSPLVSHFFLVADGSEPQLAPSDDDASVPEDPNLIARLALLHAELRAQKTSAVDSDFALWYPVTSGTDWKLLYIVSTGERLRGAVINISNLLLALRAALPGSEVSDVPTRNFRIKLLDEHQRSLSTWGNRDLPDSAYESFVSLHLKPPLQALRFEYQVPRGIWERSLYSPAVFTIIPSVLLVIGLFSATSVYLYRAKEAAMHDAAQRVNFVNHVSHELKTPLTNIRMYAELLAERLEDTDEQAEGYSQIIASECSRLTRLITNILSFSLHEKKKLGLELRPVVVSFVVDEVLEQFQPRFDDLGIKLRVKHRGRSSVQLDEDALKQILSNLLSNAEKYAGEGEYLSVRVRQLGERIFFRVTDHGPGVPRALSEKIFEPFFRNSDRLTRKANGTGLGLSISRQLARLHGGELRLTYSSGGAAFFCCLRAQPTAQAGCLSERKQREDYEDSRV